MFLANHAGAIWAADLCTVQTLTFKTLYVLVFIAHGRRELVHLAVTAHPTAAKASRSSPHSTPTAKAINYCMIGTPDNSERIGVPRSDCTEF